MKMSVESRQGGVFFDALDVGLELHGVLNPEVTRQAAAIFRKAPGAVPPDVVRMLLEGARRAEGREPWSATVGGASVVAPGSPPAPLVTPLAEPLPPPAAARVPASVAATLASTVGDVRQAAAEAVWMLQGPALDELAVAALGFADAVLEAKGELKTAEVGRAFQRLREVAAVAHSVGVLAPFGRPNAGVPKLVREAIPMTPAEARGDLAVAAASPPAPPPAPAAATGAAPELPPKQIPLVGETEGWNHEEVEFHAARQTGASRGA